MRLDYALEGFWLSKRRNYSPHTIADYELTFRRLRQFLGNPEVEDIKTADLNRFINHLKTQLGLSKKTILNHWVALSSFFSWAERELRIHHPMRNGLVERPKARRRQSLPYERHEVEAMLEACETCQMWDTKNGGHATAKRPSALRDKAMILMTVDCGIRVSEMVALRLKDSDRKRGPGHDPPREGRQ